ncbi:unnamed protein product, partial [Amoebophrya sp. A120]|eukprot:GSA120T00024297001.1
MLLQFGSGFGVAPANGFGAGGGTLLNNHQLMLESVAVPAGSASLGGGGPTGQFVTFQHQQQHPGNYYMQRTPQLLFPSLEDASSPAFGMDRPRNARNATPASAMNAGSFVLPLVSDDLANAGDHSTTEQTTEAENTSFQNFHPENYIDQNGFTSADAAAMFLSKYAAEAAWRLSSWDTLGDLISKRDTDPHQGWPWYSFDREIKDIPDDTNSIPDNANNPLTKEISLFVDNTLMKKHGLNLEEERDEELKQNTSLNASRISLAGGSQYPGGTMVLTNSQQMQMQQQKGGVIYAGVKGGGGHHQQFLAHNHPGGSSSSYNVGVAHQPAYSLGNNMPQQPLQPGMLVQHPQPAQFGAGFVGHQQQINLHQPVVNRLVMGQNGHPLPGMVPGMLGTSAGNQGLIQPALSNNPADYNHRRRSAVGFGHYQTGNSFQFPGQQHLQAQSLMQRPGGAPVAVPGVGNHGAQAFGGGLQSMQQPSTFAQQSVFGMNAGTNAQQQQMTRSGAAVLPNLFGRNTTTNMPPGAVASPYAPSVLPLQGAGGPGNQEPQMQQGMTNSSTSLKRPNPDNEVIVIPDTPSDGGKQAATEKVFDSNEKSSKNLQNAINFSTLQKHESGIYSKQSPGSALSAGQQESSALQHIPNSTKKHRRVLMRQQAILGDTERREADTNSKLPRELRRQQSFQQDHSPRHLQGSGLRGAGGNK